jgi:molybdopterin-guanine dinucleotide biosynthesis protein A
MKTLKLRNSFRPLLRGRSCRSATTATNRQLFVNDIAQNFSAVILAGGKSSRMSRDKALLDIGGKTLLARQIELVREIGAAEIFISSRAGVDYSGFGCRVLEDEFQDFGPLAGIARGLDAVREPLLLVLAVDMANMRGNFLEKLSTNCSEVLGVVPVVNGTIEPLAAFYPKSANDLIQKMLAASRPVNSPGAKHFAERCAQAGLARFVTVPPDEVGFFENWNFPADLPPGKAGKILKSW